jgi:hypothetical protein
MAFAEGFATWGGGNHFKWFIYLDRLYIEQGVGGALDVMELIGGAEELAAIQYETSTCLRKQGDENSTRLILESRSFTFCDICYFRGRPFFLDAVKKITL